MIARFLNSIRSTLLWDRVTRLSASNKVRDALDAVRFADPKMTRHISWRVFELQQLGILRNNVAALDVANSLIKELLARGSLTPNERYFLCFAKWYGQVAFRELYSSKPLPESLMLDFASLTLGEVSADWKRTFPMPIHPDWDPSRPGAEQGRSPGSGPRLE